MKVDNLIIAGVAIIAVLAIILILGGVCAACWVCSIVPGNWNNVYPIEHREDKTIHAGAGSVNLDVSTIGGNIEIVESEDGNVEVVYDVFASQGHLDEIVTGTDYSKSGDTLNVKAEAKIEPGISLGRTRGANVLVKVPKNASYEMKLKTLGGNIKVPDLNGRTMTLDTLGGNIEIRGGKYDSVKASTAGGDINVRYNATSATFETMGGNIVLNAGQTAGTLKANTAGGNIRVRLPEGTLFSVDASTMGGRVRHGIIPMTLTTETTWHIVGRTEAGAGSLGLELSTMGGDIEISY